jgi:hypothetical protein
MVEAENENRSAYRLRWIGYGLLTFALLDVVSVLVPFDVGNPSWRLQTIGALVERVVVPLLGLALVFFGEFYNRKTLEKIPLALLSWLCLLLAILSFLLAPTALLNTLGLDSQAGQQVDAGVQQRLKQLSEVENRLNQIRPEDVPKLATQLKELGIETDPQNPEKVKETILNRIKLLRDLTPVQAQNARSAQRTGLFKNTIKWALGALIASTLFFILWKTSDWAR